MVLNCGIELNIVNYKFEFCNNCVLGEFYFIIDIL